jgi:D-glycero-D-manno-heptose 1,7-bisphosphate phosphatase
MSALNPRSFHTVFLDRDGTINVKAAAGKYIKSPAELVLLPGAARAVARLNAASIRVILVTNQRWMSEKSVDPRRYAAVHARLVGLLAYEGAWLDASYHCPHATGVCDCRKPGTGMLRRAAQEHSFDLAGAVIVGDSDTDLLAGRAVGTGTILLRADGEGTVSADAVVEDLGAAVRLILHNRRNATDAARTGKLPPRSYGGRRISLTSD